LCLWVLILAGFARLLGNPITPAPSPELVVSFAALGDGKPGNGAGINQAGAAGPAIKAKAETRQPGAPSAIPLAKPSSLHSRVRPATAHHKTTPRTRVEVDEKERDEDAVRPAPAPVAPVRSDAANRALAEFPPAPPLRPALANVGSEVKQDGAVSGHGGDFGTGDGHGAGPGQASGSGPGGGDQVYDTVEHPPIPTSRVLPVYPGAARARGLEGEVVLRAIVDQHGAVEPNVVVVESVPLLDQAAIEALRQWRFEPGRDNDNRAVRVLIEVPLRFRLR
jgi:protein TonB